MLGAGGNLAGWGSLSFHLALCYTLQRDESMGYVGVHCTLFPITVNVDTHLILGRNGISRDDLYLPVHAYSHISLLC